MKSQGIAKRITINPEGGIYLYISLTNFIAIDPVDVEIFQTGPVVTPYQTDIAIHSMTKN